MLRRIRLRKGSYVMSFKVLRVSVPTLSIFAVLGCNGDGSTEPVLAQVEVAPATGWRFTKWLLSTLIAEVSMSVKVFLLDRIAVIPDVSGKYFFVSGDPAWGNDDRFGYMLGLHIGYVF